MDAFLIKTSESFQWHHSEASIKSCTAPQGLNEGSRKLSTKRNILFETFPTKNLSHYCYCCLSEHPHHNHPVGHFLLHLLPHISWYNQRKKSIKIRYPTDYFQCSLCVRTMTVNCLYFAKMARKKVLHKLTLSLPS